MILALLLTIAVRTVPDTQIFEDQKLVAQVRGDGAASWSAEAKPHRYVFRRPGCRELQLDLQFRGDRFYLPDGRAMTTPQTIPLQRTFRLNVRPMPVEADSEGRVQIPFYQMTAPTLKLTRPGFAPLDLPVPGKFMMGAAEAFPEKTVHLQPLYGPFSYWQFNVAFVPLALVTAAFMLRRRLREKAVVAKAERKLELIADVPDQKLPPMIGKDLVAQSGRRLTVLRKLGAGAMGAVFEAEEPDGEHVAVKVLFTPEGDLESFLARFHREVAICMKLRHPGLLKVLDWGDEPAPFMVSELLTGQDLRAVLEERGRLPWREATALVVSMLKALTEAHEAGIIHRDLKPENLMLTARGNIKVMDFGIARELSAKTVTQSATAIGTAHYMSPEHLDAKSVTPAADLYSIGVILYELLSGRRPFEAPDIIQVITAMLRDEPPPLSEDVPEKLRAVVMQLLSKDVSERQQTATEVIAQLEEVLWSGGSGGSVMNVNAP